MIGGEPEEDANLERVFWCNESDVHGTERAQLHVLPFALGRKGERKKGRGDFARVAVAIAPVHGGDVILRSADFTKATAV